MQPHDFSKFLKDINSDPIYVLDKSIPKSKYVALDLSESNEELNRVDVSSSLKLETYINNHIQKSKAQVAFGGYLEVRNIYKRSNHFNNQVQEERNIHLGVDLWYSAETPIFSPFDGTVHSFKNNTNHGDYGPTIILKHKVDDVIFHTLYGHLSLESIKNLEVGKLFKKGDKIATLGDTSVNGDYPPHLHFQIIKDIQGYQGDYPGVSSKKDLDFYRNNCPNPNTLLKLNS